MRLAIDTNRYMDLCRKEVRAVEVIENAAEVHVPLIVVGELRAGFANNLFPTSPLTGSRLLPQAEFSTFAEGWPFITVNFVKGMPLSSLSTRSRTRRITLPLRVF